MRILSILALCLALLCLAPAAFAGGHCSGSVGTTPAVVSSHGSYGHQSNFVVSPSVQFSQFAYQQNSIAVLPLSVDPVIITAPAPSVQLVQPLFTNYSYGSNFVAPLVIESHSHGYDHGHGGHHR